MESYVIASLDWSSVLDHAWTIGWVSVGLGLVIFVHELGHFLVAKACGVKCEKFYIGFDVPVSIGPLRLPSRFCRFQWGETEYGIGILPLGGYVKMLGQDDNPANAKAEAERIRIRKTQEGAPASDDLISDDLISGDTISEDAISEDTVIEDTVANANIADGSAEMKSHRDPPADFDSEDTHGEDAAPELDPRSFPAKPVPYRMAIISAGVIMNLIFAVIFASFAFRAGVPYMPCEIGGTVPGSPAWRAGIEEGSRIIQLGENGRPSDHLRFDWDLTNAVGLSGGKEDVVLGIRKPDDEAYRLRLRPMVTNMFGIERPMLGIEPASGTTLNPEMPVIEGFSAAEAEPPLRGGDRVIAVNGESIRDGYQLTRVLSDQVSGDLDLTVERTLESNDGAEATTTTLDVIVPPNRMRRLGMVMTSGPVVGVASNSPAAKAGIQEGDVILRIAGEPVGDPVCLPEKVRAYCGREIEITVERTSDNGGTKKEVLKITPQPPHGYENTYAPGAPMAIRSLGLVFKVTPTIASVIPDSPADWAGLRAGDEIVSIAFSSMDPEKEESDLLNEGKPIELNDHSATWPYLLDWIQMLPTDTRVSVQYRNGSGGGTATMWPVRTDTIYANRGLLFASPSETREVGSWAEAIRLGFRQTGEDMSRVVRFLKKLVTGGISPRHVGGPISIVALAGSEVSKGISRFLMFLTFLSANLAILNFLPIPALDGGHMLFLVAEGVRGKPVDERAQIALTLLGIACLLGLMVFVFALDIGRFFL